jgi:hypothetical protein
MVSQNIEPCGIDFARHFERVNDCFNGRATTKGGRSAVEPQPDNLSIVKGRPASENEDKSLVVGDSLVIFHTNHYRLGEHFVAVPAAERA